MSEIVLNAQKREDGSKRPKQIRNLGNIPGVFYAAGEDNLSIEVSSAKLHPLVFTSETHIINLKVGSEFSKKCILRDVQFDPVTDKPIHFDLQGLREGKELTLEVPVVLTGGTPVGVREGGVLTHILHKVKVSCLPKDIPEKISINVAEMEINSAVHIGDLNLENATLLESPESTIVAVFPPTVTKEPEPAEVTEEGAEEPEVVGKGKKEEEGEEAAEGEEKREKKEKKEEESK